MKQKFSTHWNSSTQPRKQRKYKAKAPLHIKRKFLGVSLSKDLRKKYNQRSIPVRTGDTVKILVGKFSGKQGKIMEVDTKNSKVAIENIQVKKMEGSKVNIMIHPSNLQIVELNTDDKKRNLKSKNKEESKKEIKGEKK